MGKSKNVSNEVKAWSHEEHKRFLDALEKYGSGSTGKEWNLMAQEVGTRSYHEIKLHAHKYFLQLQAAAAQRNHNNTIIELWSQWSKKENEIFESALANFDEDVRERWEKISPLLPGKSIQQIKQRYKDMLHDIAQIESGEHVTVHYNESDSQSNQQEDSNLSKDPISLAMSEKQNMIKALEDAKIYLTSPIASAVLQLLQSSTNCSSPNPNGRQLITEEAAKYAIDMAIKASNSDDCNVLEILMTSLGIPLTSLVFNDPQNLSPSVTFNDSLKNPLSSPKLSFKVQQLPRHNEKLKINANQVYEE